MFNFLFTFVTDIQSIYLSIYSVLLNSQYILSIYTVVIDIQSIYFSTWEFC